MAQPIGQTADPPMGQPNPAGRTAKIVLAASLLVAVAAYVVGLPLWAYVPWFVLALGGIAAITWHFRRRSLSPIEQWALEPKRFDAVPSVAWAALTAVMLVAVVIVAIRWPSALAMVALTAYFASKYWAWKVVTDRQP